MHSNEHKEAMRRYMLDRHIALACIVALKVLNVIILSNKCFSLISRVKSYCV